MSFDEIALRLGVNKRTVRLCVSKYKEGGIDAALHDVQHSGRPPEISDDDRAWIIDIACQRPKDLGHSQELWTIKTLHEHIQKYAEKAGYPRLKTVAKSTIQKLHKHNDIKPFKIKYYCEKRDPEFEAKMKDIFLVYKQVELQFDENGEIIVPDDYVLTITVSYDEKPGIQAISNTSEDLRPSENNSEVYRDYEYKRFGTVSLLAGIDLLIGEAIPLVSETHKSADFIEFLKILDKKYPAQDKIRIILDNLDVHTSNETKRYLQTLRDGRFEFVFAPKQGSWLNMIESFFNKITKQMLRGIRVKSKQELYDRIYQYFDEINKEPVIYHWKYRMDEFTQDDVKNI